MRQSVRFTPGLTVDLSDRQSAFLSSPGQLRRSNSSASELAPLIPRPASADIDDSSHFAARKLAMYSQLSVDEGMRRVTELESEIADLRRSIPVLQYRLRRAQDAAIATVPAYKQDDLEDAAGSMLQGARTEEERELALGLIDLRSKMDAAKVSVDACAQSVIRSLAEQLRKKERRLEVLLLDRHAIDGHIPMRSDWRMYI